MNALGQLGQLGPVRRTAPLSYSVVCPCCSTPGAGTLTIGVGGERVSCTFCDLLDVAAALAALRRDRPCLDREGYLA